MLKSTQIKLIKLHAAVVIFVERKGCSAKEIADILNVPVNSVYHYAKQPEWEQTLDLLNYTGDRNFQKGTTRDIMKESGHLIAQARGIYIQERTDGRNHKKAVSEVCEVLNLKRRRVNDWCARFDWEESL